MIGKFKWRFLGMDVFTDCSKIVFTTNEGARIEVSNQAQIDALGFREKQAEKKLLKAETTYPTPSYAKKNPEPDTFTWKNSMKPRLRFLHSHPTSDTEHAVVDKGEWEKAIKYFDAHPEVVAVLEGKVLYKAGVDPIIGDLNEHQKNYLDSLLNYGGEEPSGYTDEYKKFPTGIKAMRLATDGEIKEIFQIGGWPITDTYVHNIRLDLKNHNLDVFKIVK